MTEYDPNPDVGPQQKLPLRAPPRREHNRPDEDCRAASSPATPRYRL
jgi:hypothetical protein